MNAIDIKVTNNILDSGLANALNKPFTIPDGAAKITEWNVPWDKGGNPEVYPNVTPPPKGTPAIPAVPPSGPIYGNPEWRPSQGSPNSVEICVWFDGSIVKGAGYDSLDPTTFFKTRRVGTYCVYNPIHRLDKSPAFVYAAINNPTGFNKVDIVEDYGGVGWGIKADMRPPEWSTTPPGEPVVGKTVMYGGTAHYYHVYDWKPGSKSEAEHIGQYIILVLRYWNAVNSVIGYTNPGSPAIPASPDYGKPAIPASPGDLDAVINSDRPVAVMCSGIVAAATRIASMMHQPGWENIKAKMTKMFGSTGTPAIHPGDFYSQAQKYFTQLFTDPYPRGTQVASEFIPDAVLREPKTRVLIPSILCDPMVSTINSTLTTLGREPAGDKIKELVDAGKSAELLLVSKEDRLKVLAITCFNEFAVYSGSGWNALIAMYRPYLDDYYIKPLGASSSGALYPSRAQTNAEAIANATRAVELLASVYGDILEATIAVVDLPNYLMELTLSSTIANTTRSLMSESTITGAAKDAAQMVSDASKASALVAPHVLDALQSAKSQM